MGWFACPQLVFVLTLVLILAGCDKFSAGLTPPAEKITKAFPVSDEVAFAVTNYLESAKRDGNHAAASQQLDRLLAIRALSCTVSISIDRFDTPEDIRRKPVDSMCLRDQDAKIGEWIGIQRLATLLAKPPLVPATPLGAPTLLPAYEDTTVGITTAADSNVALLESTRGIFTAIRLPDGKVLQTFKGGDFNRTATALSPNGRIVLASEQSSRGLKAFDVESGALVWSTDKYRQITAWLPGVSALVVIRNAPQSGAVLLDLTTGMTSAYPTAERNPDWAIAVNGGSERQLIGGSGTAALVDHLRAPDGSLQTMVVSQWNLTRQVSSGKSGKPFMMADGTRAIYGFSSGLGWLDVATGDQGDWDLAVLRAKGFSKISESKIFFTHPASASPYRSEGKVLDIESSTLAPVTDYKSDAGQLISLAPRTGYMWRNMNTASVGADVELGEAQDLQQVLSKKVREKYERDVELGEAQDLQQVLGKKVREKFERADPPPMLTNVPADAQVAVIGVYEAKSGDRPAMAHSAGTVRITVTSSSTPLVLVLASYEPVHWLIENTAGRKISAVLLSGYYESSVYGAGDTQILRIGSNYSYRIDSQEYQELKKSVARYVSNPVRSFQGSYSGQHFTVTAF
ncbi:MAG: PQQ-like beta-propeller repeat protein [Desulfobulbus sp.]|jgi:hypothetical protein|uniref:hypothetical protein n=1 Tax=Desulfobulbus sp. TaxID=895 RepID=UPI00284152CD|nr:hypothetical protein [Desulfobulbus sp.]MDR2548820.1 PQQ-like beta-propeller repeat protein [Desulfobulbus sp.]